MSASALGASIGLAWATTGIDTSGRIISPASCKDVVGMEPTVGLTSRWLTVGTRLRPDSVGIGGFPKITVPMGKLPAGTSLASKYSALVCQ